MEGSRQVGSERVATRLRNAMEDSVLPRIVLMKSHVNLSMLQLQSSVATPIINPFVVKLHIVPHAAGAWPKL